MWRNWRNKLSWLDEPSVAVDDDDAAAVVRDFFGEAPSRLTAAASFFGEGVTPPVAPAQVHKHTSLLIPLVMST